MRLSRLPLFRVQGLLAILLVGACERNSVAPDISTEQLVGRAVALDVDLDNNTVTQASASPSASVAPGLSVALLGHNEVTTTISNVTRSNLSGPYRVRIRFDLALTNNLQGADLVPATFPEPPVLQVVAFPFATEPSSWWGGRVRATGDWNGTGQPGSGAPWNFFNNDRHCWGSAPPSDCYRWEAYGEVLPAGATTPARTVGFDIDPSVRTFRVYVVVAADVRERPLPAGTGAIAGTVSSADLGPLANVQVTAGGQTATTGSTGLFAISGLAPGDVSVTLSNLPAGCTAPATVASVAAGQVTALTLTVACAPTGPTMGAEVIAATSLQDGNAELYVLDADGTNPRRLTQTTEAELAPAVSPDARRIAFIRRTGTGANAQERLLVIDVEGTNERPLTDLLYEAANPTWSADGQHIAFTCTLPGAWGNELCVINADGSDLHIVLDADGLSFVALYPDWDPTRDRIGHVPESVANPDGSFAFVASNGAAMGRVTTGQSFAIAPAWSPDGTKLAFARITADGDVFVADAGTGAVVNLTNSAGMENSPTWTRDGSGIVYELAGNLYRVSASGGAPVPLTVNGLYANPHIR